MGSQIIFFDKNKIDISNQNAVITSTEAEEFVDFMRNRNNTSAWVTTGSVDADLTTLIFDFGERRTIDNILLIKHNLKAYTLKYWNGSTYVNFSTPVAETANALATTRHTFDEVETSKIQLIIQGTTVANSDKYIYQFIATTLLGQFEGWPVISNVELDRNRTKIQALSGKTSINENIGGFKCQLAVPNWKITDDIGIVEALYDKNEGFLMWLCGGNEDQFWYKARGYRLEDLYLMKCVNEYSPEFVKGIYISGLELKIKLEEAID